VLVVCGCRLIAQQMVKMHRTDVAAAAASAGIGLHFDTEPCLFPTLYKWLEHVPDAYSDPKQQARLSLLPSALTLRAVQSLVCVCVYAVVCTALYNNYSEMKMFSDC